MPTIPTHHLYKVYRPVETIRYNRIPDGGDFAGERVDLSGKWAQSGSGSLPERTRKDAYPNNEVGRAALFNGYSSFMAIPYGGLRTSTAGLIISLSKSNWSTGLREAIFSNDWDGPGVAGRGGWGLHLNYTAGYLSALATVKLGAGTPFIIEAKVLTSTLSAGLHRLAMGFDGQYLTLYVDGSQVAQTNAGSTGYVIEYDSSLHGNAPAYVGVQSLPVAFTNPPFPLIGQLIDPSQYFLNGTVDSVTLYTTLSGGQVIANYRTDEIQYQNLLYYYGFDYDTNGTVIAAEEVSSFSADLKNVSIVAGYANIRHCLSVRTSTGGGASYQGIESRSSALIAIENNKTYTASAYVKAAAGETLRITFGQSPSGTSNSTSITSTGAWQRISVTTTFTTGPLLGKVSIQIGNANVLVKNIYIDQVMVEDGPDIHEYFNSTYEPGALKRYYFDELLRAHVAILKTFTFLKTWTDVQNDLNIPEEMNSAGSSVSVQLRRPADNYGEGFDIDANNHVEVFTVSDAYPEGRRRFMGFISSYEEVTPDEHIEVTLLGYGAEFVNTPFEGAPRVQIDQPSTAGVGLNFGRGGGTSVLVAGQELTIPDDQYDISQIDLQIAARTYLVGMFNAATAGFNSKLRIWDNYADAIKDQYSLPNTLRPLAECDQILGSYTVGTVSYAVLDQYGQPSVVHCSPGQKIYFTITYGVTPTDGEPCTAPTCDANAYTGGGAFSVDAAGTATKYTMSDLVFQVYSSYGGTKVPFSGMDISDMLRLAMRDYNRQGGTIWFDDDSIKDTGVTVPYTFNTATTDEVRKKCIDMAPAGWYCFVDQAENKLYFRHKDDAPVYQLVLGTHLKEVRFKKATDSMCNTLRVSGSDLGFGNNLYKTFINWESRRKYGPRLDDYSDPKLDNELTAEAIGNSIVYGTRSVMEVKTTIEILHTFDLEILRPGDMIEFRNYNGTAGTSSRFDAMEFDNGSFDFDITNPESYRLPLTRFTYDPDSIKTNLSTIPPDVNKRVEDTVRAVRNLLTVDNPSLSS